MMCIAVCLILSCVHTQDSFFFSRGHIVPHSFGMLIVRLVGNYCYSSAWCNTVPAQTVEALYPNVTQRLRQTEHSKAVSDAVLCYYSVCITLLSYTHPSDVRSPESSKMVIRDNFMYKAIQYNLGHSSFMTTTLTSGHVNISAMLFVTSCSGWEQGKLSISNIKYWASIDTMKGTEVKSTSGQKSY